MGWGECAREGLSWLRLDYRPITGQGHSFAISHMSNPVARRRIWQGARKVDRMTTAIAIALHFAFLLALQVRNIQTQGFVSPDRRI